MLTALGILLLVAGAILTFAVDRQAEGVDLQAVGWILLGGGGLALLAAMIRAAFVVDASSGRGELHTRRVVDTAQDEGRISLEHRRVA